MDELLPCPFCGSKPITSTDEEGTFVWCRNVGCALEGSGYILERWQQRVLESALRARIAELNIKVENAHKLIDQATDMMTPEQVGRWHGVRTWLETLEEAMP